MGDHTGGRASDTGHQGEVNATGGYSTSVPLDLPPTRRGLSIPLSVVAGGRQVGAAGTGWDIPLSYVRVDASIAKRKPKNLPGEYAVGPTRVVMSLGDATMELLHQNVGTTPNTYVARRDGTLYTAVREANDWTVFDGHGHEYIFIDAPASGAIGLSLLETVSGTTGTEMSLTYNVHAVDVSPGVPGTAVDLTSISYDYGAAMGCAKNEIDLSYGTGSSPPLSISMISGRMFARDRVVDTITVQSRTSCVAATTLRTYKFDYTADAITNQLWLRDVKLYGRSDKPDADIPISLGSYHYNSAIDAGGISYVGGSTSAAFPAGADSSQITGEQKLSTSTEDTTRFNTPQNLLDVTGDGIPDLVFAKSGVLWSSKGIANFGGGVSFGAPAVLGDNGVTIVDSLEDRAVYHGKQDDDPYDLEQIWKQAIDVNGDGRIDIVDAWIHPNQWTVYLNTPSSGPSGVAWKEVAIDTQPLLNRLGGVRDLSDGRVSLSRRYSGTTFTTDYNGDPIDTGVPNTTSFVEWELSDLNGDGFPDFVYNTTAAHFVDNPWAGGYGGETSHTPTIDTNNDVEVMFDVGGIVMDSVTPTWAKGLVVLKGDSCGVEEWSASGPLTSLGCTFIDLTGDGIPERAAGKTALIGRGNGFGDTPATMQLPVSPGGFSTPYWNQCSANSNALYATSLQQTVRDVTGDGIPDLVGKNGIYVGTGLGFSGLVPTQNLIVSDQLARCDGSSFTYAGLFDVDGDGRPELAAIDGAGNLSMVAPTVAGEPIAVGTGRLASIDNGYGATESITYRSAKTDPYTPHQIPFPEIVVSAKWTTTQVDRSLLRTDYAYGNAGLVYDETAGSFVFPGYARTVSQQTAGMSPVGGGPLGQATVTDRYGLSDYVVGSTKEDRFARYQLVGQTSATTKVAGMLSSNPDALLAIDAVNDYRVIGRITYSYATRMFEEASAPGEDLQDCLDYVYPYDYQASLGYIGDSYDVCSAHGFTYAASTRAQRGSPTTSSNVTTQTDVTAVDDWARPTSIHYTNDVMRGEDDLCVDTTYAAVGSSGVPVRDAVATRKTWGCAKAPVTFSYDTFQYDNYPTGTVTAGFVTSETSEIHSADDGTLLVPAIQVYGASYDADGNVTSVASVRDDGALRQTTYTYDPFGMVVIGTTVSATALPSYVSSTTYDLTSLQPLASVDANGTTRGATYDGFGRPLTSTFAAPGGVPGVVSSTAYLGFTDGTGRRIATTTFDDPIDPSAIGSTPGHLSTTYLDELGRATRTETVLGASYAGQILVTGYRTYDTLGRPYFEASPFVSTDDSKSVHGVTKYYQPDGMPSCFVEANGAHPFTASTDETNGVFATCWYHGYSNYLETFGSSAPDANSATSPQAGVLKMTTVTAIGRQVSASASQGGASIDYSTYTEDRLGHLTSQTRYLAPASMGRPVTTSWHYDSFGRVVGKQEPEGAFQSNSYDSWGASTATWWIDQGTEHRIVATYDALGRVSHKEERNAGVTDADTVNDYVYDASLAVGPEVTPTNVLGRLAKATAATGSVYYSYDAFGAVNAETHVDEGGARYVQKTTAHANGTVAALDLYLPDTGYTQEHVDYTYDSASRAQAIAYDGTAGNVGLYKAGELDAYGHVLTASYGTTTYQAKYDTSGRRQLREALVSSADGVRDYKLEKYDAVGRELARAETGATTSGLEVDQTFDALGRLRSSTTQIGSATTGKWLYTYDALGNLQVAKDGVGTTGAGLAYRSIDEDEPCRIEYPTITAATCNVTHDAAGNTVKMPERTGFVRALEYFDAGQVKKISDKRSTATFRYDPFGALQELDVTGTSATTRHDRRYGAIEVHQDANHSSFITRNIAGPGGLAASLRGPSSNWVFAFGESKGTRFTVDLNGKFLQDLSYQPYGEVTSTGATLSSQSYSTSQWNGGDALTSLGVVQVGARIYDPVIGRFLSRDPVSLTHSANAANPYSFAENDPVNGSDPSGMCSEGDAMCGLMTPPSYSGGANAPPGMHDADPHHADPYSTGPRDAPADPWFVSSTADDNVTMLGTAADLAKRAARFEAGQAAHGVHGARRFAGNHPIITGIAVVGVGLIIAAPAILPALGFIGSTEGVATIGTGIMVAGGPEQVGQDAEEVVDMVLGEEQVGQAVADGPTFDEMIQPGNVNPTQSCFNCANVAATVNNIAKYGYPASAVPSNSGTDIGTLATELNSTYQTFNTLEEAHTFVSQAAPGARAIVFGIPYDPSVAYGHAFSIINEGASVPIYDMQIAGQAGFENWYQYSVMFQK